MIGENDKWKWNGANRKCSITLKNKQWKGNTNGIPSKRGMGKDWQLKEKQDTNNEKER